MVPTLWKNILVLAVFLQALFSLALLAGYCVYSMGVIESRKKKLMHRIPSARSPLQNMDLVACYQQNQLPMQHGGTLSLLAYSVSSR